MHRDPPRIVYLAHDSPGRLRVRLSWLRDRRHEATPVADALSALPGVDAVEVRPFTGSVLITYDPARLAADAVRAAVCQATGAAAITLPGHETPEQIRHILAGSFDEGSELARTAVKAFQGVHVDLLRASGGRLSFGVLASLSMWLGAAVQVLASGRIEMPEWHQLLWWGFRSFGTLEADAIGRAKTRTVEELAVPTADADPPAAAGTDVERE